MKFVPSVFSRPALVGLLLLTLTMLMPGAASAAKKTVTPAPEVVVTGIVVVTDDGPILETPDDHIFLLRGVTDTELDGLEVVVTGTAEQIEEGYFTLDVTGYSVVEEDNGQNLARPQSSGAHLDLLPPSRHI